MLCPDAQKIKVSAGLISGAKYFISLVGMLSGPAALCGMRPFDLLDASFIYSELMHVRGWFSTHGCMLVLSSVV